MANFKQFIESEPFTEDTRPVDEMPKLIDISSWLKAKGIIPPQDHFKIHQLLKSEIAKVFKEMGSVDPNLSQKIDEHYRTLLAHMGKLGIGYDMDTRVRGVALKRAGCS